MERLGPEEMEARRIDCGDAYAFQGDERDVMFLSLVSAPTEGRRIGTLASARDERRFNVAVSRARDQLWLFHSATLNDLSPKCLRYRLLEYCLNPGVGGEVEGVDLEELERLAARPGRRPRSQPPPFDSWFEVDVCLKIANRGFRVIPQLEVAGPRIDLVVEGLERKLAVECDGDEWHGPDRYLEDMARQRALERCGWTFWRVRGSAFGLDPDKALEGLWEELDHLGIRPEGARDAEESDGESSEPQAVESLEAPNLARAEAPVASGEEVDEIEPVASASIERAPVSQQDLFGSAGVPYRNWTPTQLPDPAEEPPARLLPGLVSIIEAEGPMTGYRSSRIYVKAAGRQRLGKQLRSALNRALSKALKEGLIEQEDGYDSKGYKHRVFRVAGAPRVTVRSRGDRDFAEIPPSEIVELMRRLEADSPSPTRAGLHRAVLEFYGIRRMTADTREKLAWVDSNRARLLDDE